MLNKCPPPGDLPDAGVEPSSYFSGIGRQGIYLPVPSGKPQWYRNTQMFYYYKFEEEREVSEDYTNVREYIYMTFVKFGVTNS